MVLRIESDKSRDEWHASPPKRVRDFPRLLKSQKDKKTNKNGTICLCLIHKKRHAFSQSIVVITTGSITIELRSSGTDKNGDGNRGTKHLR